MTTRRHEPPKARGKLRVVPPPPGGDPTPKATPADTRRQPLKGRDARAEAARLFAEGFNVSEVARRVGVSRQTASEWRNHRALEEVSAEKEKRAAAFEDSVAPARAKLKAGALRAAEVLVDQLDSTDPAVASAAARTLLDRVGVPRAEVVVAEAGLPDLSGLTPEELDAFEGLMRKIGGRG